MLNFANIRQFQSILKRISNFSGKIAGWGKFFPGREKVNFVTAKHKVPGGEKFSPGVK